MHLLKIGGVLKRNLLESSLEIILWSLLMWLLRKMVCWFSVIHVDIDLVDNVEGG